MELELLSIPEKDFVVLRRSKFDPCPLAMIFPETRGKIIEQFSLYAWKSTLSNNGKVTSPKTLIIFGNRWGIYIFEISLVPLD